MHGTVVSETLCGAIVVSDVAYAEDALLSAHRHDRPYVSVLLEGAYTELCGDVPRACTPGTVLWHASGEVHADYFISPGRCLNFASEAPESRALSEDALLAAVRIARPELEPALRAHVPPPARKVSRDAPAWLPPLLHAFPWVDAVPLASAARLAALHPAQFARSFREHVGMTPGRYRRRERIRAASRMLLGSSAPLSAIAHECGFSDQSHFTNVFRETAGISPQRYRRAFRR